MPARLYRPAWEEIIAWVALNWGLEAALELTSPRNIVLPGKPHRLLCEISQPAIIVLPGKRYRLFEETLSSCSGNARRFPLQTCLFSVHEARVPCNCLC